MIQVDLSGKQALIMGVTNARSLGWAIAEQLLQAGARCAFSYQDERQRPELERLTAPYAGSLLRRCDVGVEGELEALFSGLTQDFGRLDGLVHAIGFAPKAAMEGRFLDTARSDWTLTLEVSAYSFLAAARGAEPLLNRGAGLLTLTYHASQQVYPRYNVMAVANAALETTTRYLAYELGPAGVRVNAISAGAMRTVAARSIPGFSSMYDHAARTAALQRNATQEEVGRLGLFLVSPLASGITGEVIYVDGGQHIMAMPADPSGVAKPS